MRDIERDGKLLVPKDIGVSVGCAYRMSQSVRLHAHFFANGHAATERGNPIGRVASLSTADNGDRRDEGMSSERNALFPPIVMPPPNVGTRSAVDRDATLPHHRASQRLAIRGNESSPSGVSIAALATSVTSRHASASDSSLIAKASLPTARTT